jgi:competence protein ComEC
LLPHLRAQGVALDTLVLSHPDQDHIGGAASVLAEQSPQRILGVLGNHPLAADPRFVPCQANSPQARWAWDGVVFEVLHPDAPAHAKERPGNADSCVLRVQAPGASALLTGDIDQSVERALTAAWTLQASAAAKPANPSAPAAATTLLVLPHHGSRSGSSAALLDATQPHWALVQAGFRNGYGHPHPEVLARLEERGIGWRNAATCGAARFDSAQADQLHCQRVAARRYWHPRLMGEPG